MAKALDASGQYRVLRRLPSRLVIEQPDGSEMRQGLFLDVETTGLDPVNDEIIELAMVPFTYGLDGRIFQIREAFQKFRQPSTPIPPAITALTGITDEMVAGQVIDPVEVGAFASDAALVIAHNAAFDRRFAERLSDVFANKPWACSMTQIDWGNEGYEGTKLVYLAMGAGFFYDRHRAANDCTAAIELLASRLPKSGVPAMRHLLERANAVVDPLQKDEVAPMSDSKFGRFGVSHGSRPPACCGPGGTGAFAIRGQDMKPGKPSCSPYRHARLTRSAAVRERRPQTIVPARISVSAAIPWARGMTR